MKKILLILFGVVIILIISSLTYVSFVLPDVGDAPDITVPKNAENIEHGRYLANSVALCMDCHATRDWSLYAGPPIEGTLGRGGEAFDQQMGFPGIYYSKNITPFGLKDWTDGEIFRAITSGVSKDGSALFTIMPHPSYGRADVDDIYDIIAYLRSLEPIEYVPPPSVSDFPMNFIINTVPEKPQFTEVPDVSDKIAYGKYLTNLASCSDCHTQFDKGVYNMDMYLAGGHEFIMPSGIVRPANLTPDDATGIGQWTEETFVMRFKMYQDSSYVIPKVNEGEFMTMMPWLMYATMKEEDLKAIYAYLQSLEPISNQVIKFTPN